MNQPVYQQGIINPSKHAYFKQMSLRKIFQRRKLRILNIKSKDVNSSKRQNLISEIISLTSMISYVW